MAKVGRSTNDTQSHVHHYVPEWYQRRFLTAGRDKYWYCDLRPDWLEREGHRYQRRAVLPWGPASCFYTDDLYTVKLGDWSTDEIEKRFFGIIDSRGLDAVKAFSDYRGGYEFMGDAFQNLIRYMDAQRFRTPRGLDRLKALTKLKDHNTLLMAMQQFFRLHSTMWSEAVWEIVRASNSPTKFIVTDEPVTFFNRRFLATEWPYPQDVGLDQVGTRTIFPLAADSCLIITHTELVRDPWTSPKRSRINARSFQPTMRHLLDFQFGRELEEDEVLRINFIMKKRACRYVAAGEREWLYPELRVPSTEWSKLDEDWFLLPNLWKVHFTTKIMVGYNDGGAFVVDEYGRMPGHPTFDDKHHRDAEWDRHILARNEWAKLRRGKSLAQVHEFRDSNIADELMLEYLEGTLEHPEAEEPRVEP